MSDIITTNSHAVSFPEAGQNKSEVMQEFSDNAVADIQKLGYTANLHTGEIKDINTSILNEVAHLRTSIRTLENTQSSIQRNAETNIQHVDFHKKKNVSYAEDTPDSNKLVVDQRYGQVYLPASEYTPVFYDEDPTTGDLFEIPGLSANVTPIDEPIISGFQQVVEDGVPRRAFNGHNNESWVRKVYYPLEAEVTEVTCSIEVTLPSINDAKTFNTVRVNPFPVDRCDIIGIWYKPTPSSRWIVLEEYPQSIKGGEQLASADPILNADMLQYIGQTRQVYAVKVDIRQRNWVEHNNKKLFTYGLQELDFKQVEYSTLNTSYSNNDLSLNNHAIIEVEAPYGNIFERLIKLESDPNLNLEGSTTNNNHLLIFISKTPSLTPTDIVWKNTSDAPPSNEAVSLGVQKYYIIIQMKYVHQTKTLNSPFKNGTTPVLEYLTLHHQIDSVVVEGEEGVVDTTDWEGRNWALHTQFVSHMDIYRSAVEDGSNVFIFGDDFWSGLTHRDALTDVRIDNKLMSLKTASNTPSSFGSVEYQTVTNTTWNSAGNTFVPKRMRIQSVGQIPGGGKIEFIFSYTTGSGTYSETFEASNAGLINWTASQLTKVQSNWFVFDNDTEGDMTDFTLDIRLTNPATGTDQPILGQFILILKD